MKKTLPDDSYTLHTDLYQLNMIETYWRKGIDQKKAIFEVFFRDLPFDNGYAIFAGLERLVSYINKLKFTETDLEYLRDEVGYKDDFIDYLRNFKFTATIRSVVEGEVVFNKEPLIQVEGPLVDCQLVETAILNIVNYQTLIATKAARIRSVVGNDALMEFGTRRAQELVVLMLQVMYVQERFLVFLLVVPMLMHSYKHIVMIMKHLKHMQLHIKIVYF